MPIDCVNESNNPNAMIYVDQCLSLRQGVAARHVRSQSILVVVEKEGVTRNFQWSATQDRKDTDQGVDLLFEDGQGACLWC